MAVLMYAPPVTQYWVGRIATKHDTLDKWYNSLCNLRNCNQNPPPVALTSGAPNLSRRRPGEAGRRVLARYADRSREILGVPGRPTKPKRSPCIAVRRENMFWRRRVPCYEPF